MYLRYSTFKRMGKLLDFMHAKGVIEYANVRGVKHKLVTKVFDEIDEV